MNKIVAFDLRTHVYAFVVEHIYMLSYVQTQRLLSMGSLRSLTFASRILPYITSVHLHNEKKIIFLLRDR